MPVKFIAEISSNHNRDLERAKRMIDRAAEINCDGVKFQLFQIDKLFAPEILSKSVAHRRRKEWELPLDFIPELSNYAHQKDLLFSCTPFYLKGVNELSPYVDFFKIASYELLWKELFVKISETGKPLTFATGMATMDEIVSIIKVLNEGKSKEITILHCSSAYPTPVVEANLRAIDSIYNEVQSLNTDLRITMGWSDHTVSPAVIYRAVHKFNVSMVEFHLDLDGNGEEYQAGHCWLPDEIGSVIQNIHEGQSADGDGIKVPMKAELPDRLWRADPDDGLRPFKQVRKSFKSKKSPGE